MPRLAKDGKTVAYAPIPHVLERVRVSRKNGAAPKSFDDYEVSLKDLEGAIAKGTVEHRDLLKEANDAVFAA
jgi:hypothetical protein